MSHEQNGAHAGCLEDIDIPAGWENVSWGNDMCASIQRGDAIIYIDYPLLADREYETIDRFTIQRYSNQDETQSAATFGEALKLAEALI